MKQLNWWQKFLLKVNGEVFTGYEQREGWTASNAIYVCRCSRHGLYSGMHHGHANKRPQCPSCMEELTAKALLLNQKV